MDDSSTDVLNDIDALLNKLKHLPEGSRRDVLSNLQARLQTEVPTENAEPTPSTSNNEVTPPIKDTASTEIEKNDKSKQPNSDNQPAEKELYVVHVQQNDDEVIHTKDQDVIHILSVENLTEKRTSPRKVKRKSPRGKKKSNNKPSTAEEVTKSPQRRVLTLPSRFSNFSGVPTFLKSPKREPVDDSAKPVRERKTRSKETIQECQIVLTKLDEGVPLSCAKLDDGSQIEDATFGAKILLAAAERNELEDLNGTSEVRKIKIEVDGAKPERRRRRKKCTREDKTCPICERVYVNACYLRIHMRKHTGEKPYRCERCEKHFSQKSSLWVHMKRHEGKFDHQCPHCDYKSVLKIDLDRHMPKHTGAKIYICELCGKMFTTDIRLKDHIRHVHERKEKHYCDQCEFFTHRPDNLRRHLAVKHSDDELFKCPICGDVLKQRSTLIVHLRRHTGERPHVCSECQKGFKSLSQLAVHRRIHKEGEFTCPDCSRVFKTKHHLIRHSVIHSGEKPFACLHCPYTCNVKGNINKHMKSVHKLSNFSFRRLKKQDGRVTPSLMTGESEKSAVERGEQVTNDFLKRISLRKDENLTVEKLQQMMTVEPEEVHEEPVILKPARPQSSYAKRRSAAAAHRASALPSKFHTYDLTARDDAELATTVLHAIAEDEPKVEVLDLDCTDQEGRSITSAQITSYSNGYPVTCVITSNGGDEIQAPVTVKESNSPKQTDENCGDLLLFSVKECLGEQVTTIESANGSGILSLPMQVQDVCEGQDNDSASGSTICYVIQVAP